MATREELEKWALDDYAQIVGKTILVSELSGYVRDVTVDFDLDPPAVVKVGGTSKDEILHWNDEWLDPYWNLDLLKSHPQVEGARSFWMFGDSYTLDGKYQPARYEPRVGPREWSPRKVSDRKRRR